MSHGAARGAITFFPEIEKSRWPAAQASCFCLIFIFEQRCRRRRKPSSSKVRSKVQTGKNWLSIVGLDLPESLNYLPLEQRKFLATRIIIEKPFCSCCTSVYFFTFYSAEKRKRKEEEEVYFSPIHFFSHLQFREATRITSKDRAFLGWLSLALCVHFSFAFLNFHVQLYFNGQGCQVT